MRCLNENCLLNENHLCGSVFVSKGNASCEGRHKVQPKHHFKPNFNYKMVETQRNVRKLKVYI